MKTLIIVLVLIAVGFGVWLLLPTDNPQVSFEPTPTVSSADYFATATPTPEIIVTATPTATPRRTATPVPGQGGTGQAPIRTPIFTSLTSLNGSGEYGVVALTASNNDLATITFNLTGGPAGITQSAYLVNGTCANLGNFAFGLNPLINGYSSTTLNVNFLDIANSSSRLAIVVYSPYNSSTATPYSCGQLR